MQHPIKTLHYVNLVDLPGGREAHAELAESGTYTFGDTPFTLITRDDMLAEIDFEEHIDLWNALDALPKDVYVNLEAQD